MEERATSGFFDELVPRYVEFEKSMISYFVAKSNHETVMRLSQNRSRAGAQTGCSERFSIATRRADVANPIPQWESGRVVRATWLN